MGGKKHTKDEFSIAKEMEKKNQAFFFKYRGAVLRTERQQRYLWQSLKVAFSGKQPEDAACLFLHIFLASLLKNLWMDDKCKIGVTPWKSHSSGTSSNVGHCITLPGKIQWFHFTCLTFSCETIVVQAINRVVFFPFYKSFYNSQPTSLNNREFCCVNCSPQQIASHPIFPSFKSGYSSTYFF